MPHIAARGGVPSDLNPGIFRIMASPRRTLKRIEAPTHGRFLTFSCTRRLPLFQNDRIKDAFVEELGRVRQEMGF